MGDGIADGDVYLGGLLAEPVTSWPGVFGVGSWFGGEVGVQWMKKYPYALPNLISACFLMTSAIIVVLALEEVSHSFYSYLFQANNMFRHTTCSTTTQTTVSASAIS